MTSLPIYWPEGVELSVVIEGSQMPWVRRELEERYDLVPLDTLSPNDNGGDGLSNPLADIERLLIVQPRGLSPDDNVALDEWMRGGGRLLYRWEGSEARPTSTQRERVDRRSDQLPPAAVSGATARATGSGRMMSLIIKTRA